jgi:uncharacterized membrane protein YkoI
MPVSRKFYSVIVLGLAAVAALALPGWAADASSRACLSKAEQRAAVASHQAIPLARAIKSLHARGRRGEVVRAELCHSGGELVYVLTLLARNGKVTRAHVDASSGELINGH